MRLAECRALLGHAEWADALVWKAVHALGHEDVELHAKLHHLHAVQWAYLHIWRGEAIRPREPGSFATLRTLGGWAREYYRELPAYLGGLEESVVDGDVRFPWADKLVQRFGRAHPANWAQSVLQVAMHSSYHRGQVAQRLRVVGGEPPLTDFVAWVWMASPAADWGEDDAA